MNLHQMNRLLSLLCKKHKDPILKNFLLPPDPLLDKYQTKATFSPYKRCLVLAGAGSGKTKVITTRIASLLKLGVSPEKMRIITFTNKATIELKERLHTLTNLPQKSLDKSVCTIHKLAIRTLRKIEPLANFHITKPTNPHDPILKIWNEEISTWIKSHPEKTPYLLELFSNPPKNLKMENTYPKQFHLKDLKFPTHMGVKVRSRWERRIVNYLASQHIHFKYEEPILWAWVDGEEVPGLPATLVVIKPNGNTHRHSPWSPPYGPMVVALFADGQGAVLTLPGGAGSA